MKFVILGYPILYLNTIKVVYLRVDRFVKGLHFFSDGIQKVTDPQAKKSLYCLNAFSTTESVTFPFGLRPRFQH